MLQILKSWYRRIYGLLADLVLSRYLKLYADATILFASGYLLATKFYEPSPSEWLPEWLRSLIQNQVIVDWILHAFALFLLLAVALKVLSILFGHFPPPRFSSAPLDEVSDCLLVINKELFAHAHYLVTNHDVTRGALQRQHAFNVNLRVIVSALAEQIRTSIDAISLKRKDVFISVYTFDEAQRSLIYELHFDEKRDLVKSKRIDLQDDRYASYECVKCLNGDTFTTYVLNRNRYARGHSKRHKTVRHYMGVVLTMEEMVFGFMNIEFHNKIVFDDEYSMMEFMESTIFPFKLLIEYEFIKRLFLSNLPSDVSK